MLRPSGTATFALTAATALLAGLPAQDDLRDVVRTRDGREVRGRVATPFADDEVLLLQGGKRVRIPRAEITALDTVNDRLFQFLDRRAASENPRLGWFLVEWAASRELTAMARLQAFDLVLRDDDHEPAHLFLGHRQTSKGWLWELDGRWLTREQFLQQWGSKRAELRSEHFAIRADGGFAQTVAALIDLESLYQWWFTTFGKALGLREVMRPMVIETWRNPESFPKWGFRVVPFHVPDPHGDTGRTFYATNPDRPRLLFFLGTQGILYHALAQNPRMQDDRDRICPWLEIGLGMVAESVLQGPAGRARPGSQRHLDLQAMNALGRDYRLTHLLHLPMYGGFYLMDDTPTATNWSAAQTLVAYLLDPGTQPPTREAFVDYVRQVFAERKGDSSTAFDKAIGRRIEDIEPDLVRWLNKQAGF